MRIRNIALATLSASALVSLSVAPAFAAAPTPAKTTCGSSNYACLTVNQASVPAGQTVIFKGSLSTSALKNLASWTKGSNIVCLTRYKATAESNGSWPWTTLDGACAQVNKAGKFTINAELGQKGPHYFGVEMGPCQADADQCGNSDGGLVGLDGKSAVYMTTT